MNVLRRLFGGNENPATDNALHLYVRCQRCGSPVHVRIDPANDLMADYGDTGIDGYYLSKEIMDAKCFRLMRANITFDRGRRELDRSIEGGDFISAEEYTQLAQPTKPQAPSAS